jgi:hypothetical protein
VLITCWSAKGGSGTSVVAAALALVSAGTAGTSGTAGTAGTGRAGAPGAVDLVDTEGDLPAVLGLPEPTGPGLADWLAGPPDRSPALLDRLRIPVVAGLGLVPRGSGGLDDGDRATVAAAALAAGGRRVVADAGCARSAAARAFVERADVSLLVVRNCYLALRRAVATDLRPTGVVMVREPGRALERADVEGVLGVPVRAVVDIDPALARAVDAGLLVARVPAGLRRQLRHAA